MTALLLELGLVAGLASWGQAGAGERLALPDQQAEAGIVEPRRAFRCGLGGAGIPELPRAFRCVLDERPRMLVVQLTDDLWVAYNAGAGAFCTAWQDGVRLEGAVYDTTHGPQPSTVGPALLSPKLGPGETAVTPWRYTPPGGDGVDVTLSYRGYRREPSGLRSYGITVNWELELPDGTAVEVRERPRGSAVEQADGKVTVYLQRSFEVSGLPAGARLGVATGVWRGPADELWTGCPSAIAARASGEAAWPAGAKGLMDSEPATARRVREWLSGDRARRADWTPIRLSIGEGRSHLTMSLFPAADPSGDDEEEDL